jgi:predicted permease
LGVLASIALASTTVRRWCWAKVSAAGNAVATCSRGCLNKLAALRQRLRQYPIRKPLLLALAVGGLATLIALVAPQWVAATLSGLGGVSVTLFVQVGLWLRQRFGSLVAATE